MSPERQLAVKPPAAGPALKPGFGVLQRKCACGGPGGPEGECEECKQKEKSLQRRASGVGRAPTRVPPIVHEVLRSPGRPLDAATRAFMEPRFGHDFSKVRVHADERAAASARAVNALAYTVGSDVVFAGGQYAPAGGGGRRLIAHELSHVVQQSGQPQAGTGNAQAKLAVNQPGDVYEQEADRVADRVMNMLGAAQGLPRVSVGHRISGLLQRDNGEGGVHTSRPAAPFEKSSPSVESMYRRAGLVEAANAVRKCREGDCSHVLTEAETYQAYRTGRVSAGLGDPPAAEAAGGTKVLAVAGVAPLTAPAGETAAGTAAKTALERAALRWGTAEVIEGGAAAAEAAPAAAAAPGAAAATVAIPVAVGVYVALAVADLIGYTSFQLALHRQGYVILPNPLGVCIAGCHQPAAPDYQPFEPRFLPKPHSGPLTPGDRRIIEEWLKGQELPQPVPQPEQKKDKRDECLANHPSARVCTDFADRDEIVIRFLMNQGNGPDALGECHGMSSFGPGVIAACDGAPGEVWHCMVKGTENEVSVFACLCCHEDGSTGWEWRGAHWSVNLSTR